MATAYKVLGQVAPTANSDTTLYTVPASTSTVVSTIVVCNTASSAYTFRIAIRPGGETIATKHYLCYDIGVPPNDSITFTLGITLATTDIITVRASNAAVAFSAFGSEIT